MSPSISHDAVREATGLDWTDWFAGFQAAERAAGGALDHRGLVAWVKAEHPGLSGWWRQMVAVEYEKHAGRRVTGETADTGFQLGVQKTMAASADDVWAALVAPSGLASWLGDDLDLVLAEGSEYGGGGAGGSGGEVRVVVPGDRVRLTWQPGEWPRPSTLQVRVTAKGAGKTVVSVHHEHLPDVDARQAMRRRWKAALAELTGRVEP